MRRHRRPGAGAWRSRGEIFGRPEMQCDDRRRRIVDRAEKRERRAPPLEPRKGAAVELEQLPGRGLARAPGPMLGGPAPMDGGPPERQGHAAHRFARDGELVDLAQLLGQVRIVEARVAIG